MKGQAIEKLVRKHLLPHLSDWEVRRNVMFLRPIGACFCAVGFVTSGFDSTLVHVEAFVSPLYLQPRENIYSKVMRINREGGFDLSDNTEQMRQILVAIHEQAVPFIATVSSAKKLASGFTRRPQVTDPYELEAIAMSFVLLNNRDMAVPPLEIAIRGLLEDGRQWCLEMADRLYGLLERVNSDFGAFRAELPKWWQENLAKEGLSTFQGVIEWQ